MYEFDLKEFLAVVFGAKKRILINCGVAFVIAVVVAFSIPKEYLASASLASEMQDERDIPGGLGSLASMAGINFQSGANAIVPVLYPDVVHSNSFLVGLLDVNVKSMDGSVDTDYLTYLREYTREPWWAIFGVWIGKLKKTLLPSDVLSGYAPVAGEGKINSFCMSLEDAGILNSMRSFISCSVDDETQVITVQVRAQDPLIAAMLVDSVCVHLQRFITNYHTNKARVDLDYYQKLELDARHVYDKVQREYAEFCDSHKGMVLQSYMTEQERLENELQLAYTAYSQMKQQVQMAEAKVQEQTPAFTEIEGASVPLFADSPKKMLILIAFVFLAFVGTVGWLYVRLLFSRHG